MTEELCDRLLSCHTAIVHDIMRARGSRNFVLPSRIRPIRKEWRIAGPVWTVEGHVDEAADPHETLLAWTGLLSEAPVGHVIVCQPLTHDIALMGELSSEALELKGVRGYVVDGATRDVETMASRDFPVACSHFTPKDIVGRWLPHELGGSTRIGEVRIRTGDFLLADRDGICLIPSHDVEAVITESEQAMQTESSVRSAIREGIDPKEAYLRFGKF